jgi:hypothetical protein
MAQIIFENLDTGAQHFYPSGFMFEDLPDIGATVTLYDGKEDKAVLDGVIENISWSLVLEMANERDFSVFVYVRPVNENPRPQRKTKIRKVSRR